MKRLIAVIAVAVAAAASLPAVRADRSPFSWRRLFAHPPRSTARRRSGSGTTCSPRRRFSGRCATWPAQKVKQVFVHPRPGLMTPYLSAEWFRLWKVALDEAERLDMNVWIYDENSYPSGFAGGFVPEAMPESRGRGPGLPRGRAAPRWADDTLAVFRAGATAATRTSPPRPRGGRRPAGGPLPRRLAAACATPVAWYGGKCYVDLLYPGVTEKFLGDHAGRLQARDRRRVRQARARRRSPTSRSCARPAACPGPTACPRRSRSAGATACSTTCRPCASRSATGSRSGTTTSRSCSSSSSSAGRKPYYDYCEKQRPRVHRPLLGARVAQLRRRARQHGHVRLAAAARHRQPDEPVRGGHARPVRQRPRRQGAVQRRQPARPRAHAVRGLRRRRLGPALRGHEAHRRLAVRARRQHARRAPLLRHPPRRAQARPPAVVLLPRAVVGRLPRVGRVLHAALGRPCRRASRSTTSCVLEPTTTAWMYNASEPKPAGARARSARVVPGAARAPSKRPRSNTTSAARTSSPATARCDGRRAARRPPRRTGPSCCRR